MAKGLVSNTNLTAIANAIRAKNGSSDTYTPATMATAISNIPTSQVDQTTALQWMLNNKTNYTGIAAGLTNLTTLPAFTQPSGVIDFTGAFSGCSNLTSISSVNLTQGTRWQAICDGCSNLVAQDIAIKTPAPQSSIDYAFRGCANVIKVSFGNNTTQLGNVGSAIGAFSGCSSLKTFGYRNYVKAPYCKDCTEMFKDCTSLASVKIDSIGSSGPNMDLKQDAVSTKMFYGCTALKTVSFQSTTDGLKNLTVADNMFRGCNSLTSISINQSQNFEPRNIANMFRECTSLTTVSGIDFSLVKNANSAFYGCAALTTIPSAIDFSSITSSGIQFMFSGCTALSNDSLNSILGGLSTVTYSSSTDKTLQYIGLTSAQATTCTGLSNWAAAQAAGWRTGY